MFKRILVPFDFSEAATHALQEATRLAAEQGVGLTILHVYHPPEVAEWLNPELVRKVRKNQLDNLERRLSEQAALVLPQ